MHKKWFRVLLRRRILVIFLLVIQAAVFAFTIFSSSRFSAVIRALLLMMSFAASLHIVSQKKKGSYKLIWIFLILLVPMFGGLLYIIINVQMISSRYDKRFTTSEAKSRKYLEIAENSYDTACESVTFAVPQIRYLQQFAGFPVYAHTTAKYMPLGEVKFKYLIEELKKAEKYIFLEYFVIEEGVMWNTILEILKEKTNQGVKVRVIYDDLGCFFTLPKDYPQQLREFGIECVVFNHFRPIMTVIQNNRDHRKIVSIDGKVCFTGGINLADEYINVRDKHGHWKDTAIMIKGEATWSFTMMFLQMWQVCTGVNENYSEYYPWHSAPCEIESDGFVQPYCDSPLDEEHVGEHVYLHIINNAKDYVYINTPYLIVDDSMVSALTLAAKSGVDVRIVTPHRGDKWFVHMTTRSYYRELINAGVKIYEYSKGFVHAKTFISDDGVATVGTINLDFRSLYLHFECGTVLYNNSQISEMKEDYMKTLESCEQINAENCRHNAFIRFVQDVLRLFAPLM